jgi:membrane protease YdiL (CAAX protease family)
VLTGESWRLDPVTPAIMAAESVVLTIPAIIFGVLIAGGAAATSISPTEVAELSLGSRLAISIGAGLYEELLFRMLLIAVVHTLLVDVGKLSTWTGALIAVVISAVAFAWYHPLSGFTEAFFFFVAGLYFGAIYVVRGFGIVVGVHAFYDVIVVTLMNGGG